MSIPPKYNEPVLVSGTDGVGTKLMLAIEAGVYDTIGIDLVAMCVNDIIVVGAEPLFFLDYYATGKLDLDVAEAVIKGIADGCDLAGASLTGGETAEMPDMYAEGDFDLAGFTVGVVEKSEVLDQSSVQRGDVIVGLASSGPHSNGYSLIRKVVEVSGAKLDDPFASSSNGSASNGSASNGSASNSSAADNLTLGETLLAPTCIYVKPVLNAIKQFDIHAIAHITGGGITENIPRVLPANSKAVIDLDAWERPEIFNWLQTEGNIEESEMLRTFNCGVGLTLIVSEDAADDLINTLRLEGIQAWSIGRIEAEESEAPFVDFQNLATGN